MPLSIGLEACGQNSTVLAVAEEDGTIIAAERYETRMNYHEAEPTHLGLDIYDRVQDILTRCNVKVAEFSSGGGRLCAGITGITTRYDRERGMVEVWNAAGQPGTVRIATGGIEIAFTGGTRSIHGAAITCRAGSAALARTESRIKRVGGWGSLLGDEGSGYWIGSRAIQAICRLRDQRLKQRTNLGQYVKDLLMEIPVSAEILREYLEVSPQWIDGLVLLAQRTKNSEFRYVVSSVAKAVFRAWGVDKNDEVVKRIVNDAARLLVSQAEAAMSEARVDPNEITLLLRGGVFRYHPEFALLVKDRLLGRWSTMRVLLPTDPSVMRPVIGALLFALSGSVFKLPNSGVVRRIKESAGQFPALKNVSQEIPSTP